MRKKIVCFLASMAACAAGAALVAACGSQENSNALPEPRTEMFFSVNGYADTVYSISESSMSGAELTAIVSLQGILAQTQATIYIRGSEGATAERLEELSLQYNFEIEPINDAWELIDMFADMYGGKYVLYNDHSDSNVTYNDQSINYATTISGAEGLLMIGKNLEITARQHGLTLGVDATATEMNTRYIFENYKGKLNNGFLVHQNPQNRNLRDYAIAGKAMCFYSDYYDGDSSVKTEILDWAKENAPILGWTENELNFVSGNSVQSVVTVAADHAANLSLYAAGTAKDLKQNNLPKEKIKAEKGKHYVAVVMSDGDNVQWMTRGFSTSDKYYGSPYRGSFPMTWTTSPALYDLAPDILSGLYHSATANDLFLAGPSGVGYINATEYNQNSLASYAAYTAGYMQATDMQYINFLDNAADKKMLDAFSAYEQVKGGVWSIGNKYIEGQGGVYWSNDKPFVSARETLWRIAGDDASNKYYGFVERVAQRINNYSTDCTKIEGYTIVLAHAWTIGSMDYINRFVSALDDDVVLVTVDNLLNMIDENVAHVDALPQDIAPTDLDDRLAPISSEQYDWNALKNTRVTPERDFVFDCEAAAKSWYSGNGGLEYDSVTWTASDTGGKPAVKLDGSDLDDAIDPLPNSWIYNMFELSSDLDKDNYLYCYIAGGINADVNYRVRALYEENGSLKAVVLASGDYEEGSVNDYGWYKRTGASPARFMYDLSALKGKKALISIEQDDTGDGSGEIVYVRRIAISDDEIIKVSAFPNWATDDIRDDWRIAGNVETHSEGICLEARKAPSSICYTFTVTEETKWAKFYVRMFVRQDTPDIPPQLELRADGNIVKAYNAPNDYVVVTTDTYRCIAYDLSAYVGREITLTFSSLKGDHAAIARITLAEQCTLAEVTKLYSDGEVKQL